MKLLHERLGKVEDRQDKLEELQRLHREEFIETRSYVKESYQALKEIRLGIESLKQHTAERIDQQGRYYREELKVLQEQIRQAEIRLAAAEKNGEDGSGSKHITEFAWKVVAGVLALATAILGLLQVTGGGSQ